MINEFDANLVYTLYFYTVKLQWEAINALIHYQK